MGVVALRQEGSDRAFWAANYGSLAGWALAITSAPTLSHDLASAAFVDVLTRHGRPARWRLYADVLGRLEVAAGDVGGHPGWLWRYAATYPTELRRCVLLEAAALPSVDVARVLRLHPRRRVQALLGRCAELAPPLVVNLPRQASLISRTS